MLLLLSACAVWHPPVSGLIVESQPTSWDDVLAHPVPAVELESVVSGRWVAKAGGLINTDSQAARDAGWGAKDDFPIVLVVHVVDHPKRGRWIVDTGVALDDDGDVAGVKGLVASVLGSTEITAETADIVRGAPLNGVLLTHRHLDHVMGMGDIRKGTPIVTGPGEWDQKKGDQALSRRSYRGLLKGHDVRELRPEDAVTIGEFQAWDLHGDGSFWALWTPGHTAGSLSFLVNNGDPTLLVGDTSHTWWGWDNGVEPGGYTQDNDRNQESLQALKRLAEAHDLRVEVGHEVHPSISAPRSPGSAE